MGDLLNAKIAMGSKGERKEGKKRGEESRSSVRRAHDPDGVGEGDDAKERVAGDREGDHEDVEDQVDAELEADSVFDRDGEGWEDKGEDDEEDGGHD